MDIYDFNPAQLEQTLSRQVSPVTLASVLSAVGGANPVTVDVETGNAIFVQPGTDLVVSSRTDIAGLLDGTPRDANGAIFPSGDAATFVSNVTGAPTTILTETSNFFELVTGSDTVVGGDASTLVVDASHDTSDVKLEAGANYSFLLGGPGADTLVGSTSSNGMAIMVAGSGPTTINGGAGQDSLFGGGRTDMIGGTGAGQNLLGGFSAGAMDTLTAGTGGGETLAVGQGNNVLDDRNGNGTDTLFGGAGDDTLYSGNAGGLFALRGNSDVVGGAGNDSVFVELSAKSVSIDGGGGTNFVTFDGHTSGDATVTKNNDGSTTVSFAATSQTANLTNVSAVFFGNDTATH